jgi:hypothetical protein
MLSKCANPGCSNPFRYLHEGKLFSMENEIQREDNSSAANGPNEKKSVRRLEFFWLCDNCASTMTLVYEKGIGVKARPLVASKYRRSAA